MIDSIDMIIDFPQEISYYIHFICFALFVIVKFDCRNQVIHLHQNMTTKMSSLAIVNITKCKLW